MKDLDPAFITEKNKQVIKPIRLYTVYDYDNAGANLYFAEYSQNVTFDSILYTAFPIQFQSVTEHTGGEVDEVKLTVSNVSRLIEAYLQNPDYTFKGKKVDIIYVFVDQISDPDVKYVEKFFIDFYETNARTAIFTLSSLLDIQQVKLPLKTVMRTNCEWIFKGVECKYAGPESSCSRTLQRCRELENTLNYGGFPAAGGRRMFT